MEFEQKKPIFIQIKDYYAHLIEIGALKEGDEMPSVREVAIQNGVNPNTVQRAFTLLVEDGYLSSIEKKGFFVLKKGKDKKQCLKTKLKELVNNGFTIKEINEVLEEINNDRN